MKKFLAIALAVVIACVAFVGCSATQNTENTDNGKAKVHIILVEENGTETPYDIEVTDGVTLREAMKEAALIGEEDESSFMIETIDGKSAKMADGVLWMICDENGDQMSGTCDDITVSNDQTIKFVYTVAPNFDD